MSSPAINIHLVDTVASIDACISDLTSVPFDTSTPDGLDSLALQTHPVVAVDIEGVRLNRFGRMSIVQLKLETSNTVWLLDVTTFGRLVFDHTDSQSRSIRQILESPDYKKIFYDVRNDSDALFNWYGIDMKNVCDLQILELAVRHSTRRPARYLNGLSRSIESYLHPGSEWKKIKDEGIKLFAPELGGSYEVFEQRPVDPRVLAYCAQDVTLLHRLERVLWMGLGVWGRNWDTRVMNASERRVQQAKLEFVMEGRHKALSPII